jgi:hypothetical protein
MGASGAERRELAQGGICKMGSVRWAAYDGEGMHAVREDVSVDEGHGTDACRIF